jgi:hypothetical protein
MFFNTFTYSNVKKPWLDLGPFWIEIYCFPVICSTTIKTLKQMFKKWYL